MITITVSNKLEITGLPAEWVNWLQKVCTYDILSPNPEIIKLYDLEPSRIVVPRGLESLIVNSLKEKGYIVEIVDATERGEENNFTVQPHINYTSEDWGYQGVAIDNLLKHRTGRLEAPTASGKTCIACVAIAKLGVAPVLFLTMRDNLLDQFKEEVTNVLGIPKKEIGVIKGRKLDIKPVTVGSLPTIGSKNFMKNKIDQIKDKFAVVFFDECHRSKAITYRESILQLNPSRLYGVSATPEEFVHQDTLRLMEALLGPIVVRIQESDIPGRITPSVYLRQTGLTFLFEKPHKPWEQHIKRLNVHRNLMDCNDRNNIIINDVEKILLNDSKNQILICTILVEHAYILYQMLKKRGIECCFPYKITKDPFGDIDKSKLDAKQQKEDIKLLETGKKRVLLGTYNAFQEGFNCKSLNTVMFVGAVSGKNHVRNYQVPGRCTRKFQGKENVYVIYYTDSSFPETKLQDWAEDFRQYCTNKWKKNVEIIPPPT